MDSIADMIMVDPTHLLPEHRHLLEQDFRQLGEGQTIERQYWLANRTLAVQAREAHMKGGIRIQ